MLQNGVEIKERHEDLIEEFDKALKEHRVYFIKNGNKVIGFLTHEMRLKDGKVRLLINKCLIYKEFRNPLNFVRLRKRFREIYNMEFYGVRKRNNRLVLVK